MCLVVGTVSYNKQPQHVVTVSSSVTHLHLQFCISHCPTQDALHPAVPRSVPERWLLFTLT